MARADYVQRVKEMLYGTALGERPPLRLAAADADEAVTGRTVTFKLATGEGAHVKPGHVLAVDAPASAADSHALYVLSVSTDTVTAVNGYFGSPAVTADDLDGVVFEQNPPVTTYLIHRKIGDVFSQMLWPYVFKFVTVQVTPNLATYQADLPAAVMDIDSAWQTVAGIHIPVPFRSRLNHPIAQNGVLGSFGFIDGSTTFVRYVAKLVEGDETTVPELVGLVATGAAALCLGAMIPETNMASASKDSQSRAERDPSSGMWRDFLALRASMSEGLSRERGSRLIVDRG